MGCETQVADARNDLVTTALDSGMGKTVCGDAVDAARETCLLELTTSSSHSCSQMVPIAYSRVPRSIELTLLCLPLAVLTYNLVTGSRNDKLLFGTALVSLLLLLSVAILRIVGVNVNVDRVASRVLTTVGPLASAVTMVAVSRLGGGATNVLTAAMAARLPLALFVVCTVVREATSFTSCSSEKPLGSTSVRYVRIIQGFILVSIVVKMFVIERRSKLTFGIVSTASLLVSLAIVSTVTGIQVRTATSAVSLVALGLFGLVCGYRYYYSAPPAPSPWSAQRRVYAYALVVVCVSMMATDVTLVLLDE